MVPRKQSHGLTERWRVVWVTIALLPALVVTACAIPEEGFDGSLEGSYYINGFDQQDVEYSGLLTITATDTPDVYDMQWIITGSVQQGRGRVEGGELLVDWQAVEGFDTTSRGTAVFDIGENGELRGERSVAGQAGSGTEEAFPVR